MEFQVAPPEVHPYSLQELIRLTAELSGRNTAAEIAAKAHPTYLDGYFRHLNVETIVVEKQYIDRDYLEDFSAYYVKCFEQYDRFCSRLHFFSKKISKETLRKILLSPARYKELQDSYCGFIVIKPLPKTVFGRTCLKTYSNEKGRCFPVARTFRAHLFGIPLDIPGTLPFQEQDNIVAACATSALWSVLQATAREFHHPLMTPIDITRAAIYLLPAANRMIPNREGLSTTMMAEAIRSVGLEPVLLDAPHNDDRTLKAGLYAYLHARIPIIMGIHLHDKKTGKLTDAHAIAITGFKLSDEPATPSPSGLRLRSSRIEKIYAHDDQVGPFARMEFDGKTIRGTGKRLNSLSTSYGQDQNGRSNYRAVPQLLLVPVYHKIRIHFDQFVEIVADIHGFLSSIKLPGGHRSPSFEWDVYLTTINELKIDIASSDLSPDARALWLMRPMPRFIWRATLYSGEKATLDLIVDATDIHTSGQMHGVLIYDNLLQKFLASIATSPNIQQINEALPGAQRMLESIARNIVKKTAER
jgi:hypothetical protein